MRLNRRQKLERYLWFLLLRSKQGQLKGRLMEMKGLVFNHGSFDLLLEKLMEFKPAYSLESFTRFLPEDLQQ